MNDDESGKEPRRNHLLNALPEDVWQRWQTMLEPAEMRPGQVVYEPDATLSHVYLPTTAIVSLLHVMNNGAPAEIAVVGNEGVTAGATKLQKAGFIRYARGRITVLDRAGLEHRSCECYAVVKTEYDRLLPQCEAA